MFEEDCRRQHASFILRDFIRYLVIEKETGEVLDRFAFPYFQSHWAIPQFGISYFLLKSAQGKGYATEATRAMTRLVFEIFRAKKVEILCDVENFASQGIPQRLGFTHECTMSGGWPRTDSNLAKLHLYAIFSANDLMN